MSNRAEFNFRIYVHPEGGDLAEIETWYQGLRDLSRRSVEEWAQMSLCDQDFYKLFDLDKTKHWQVVGKAIIRGWWSFDEYDEDIDIIEFEKVEVLESSFDDNTLFHFYDDSEIIQFLVNCDIDKLTKLFGDFHKRNFKATDDKVQIFRQMFNTDAKELIQTDGTRSKP